MSPTTRTLVTRIQLRPSFIQEFGRTPPFLHWLCSWQWSRTRYQTVCGTNKVWSLMPLRSSMHPITATWNDQSRSVGTVETVKWAAFHAVFRLQPDLLVFFFGDRESRGAISSFWRARNAAPRTTVYLWVPPNSLLGLIQSYHYHFFLLYGAKVTIQSVSPLFCATERKRPVILSESYEVGYYTCSVNLILPLDNWLVGLFKLYRCDQEGVATRDRGHLWPACWWWTLRARNWMGGLYYYLDGAFPQHSVKYRSWSLFWRMDAAPPRWDCFFEVTFSEKPVLQKLLLASFRLLSVLPSRHNDFSGLLSQEPGMQEGMCQASRERFDLSAILHLDKFFLNLFFKHPLTNRFYLLQL